MAEMSETRQELALVSPSDIIFCGPGNDAVLSCHLEPVISAASMEIKWWNKADLVCHYKNGQMTVSREYEGQVSLLLQELQNGNVSLTLRDVRRSQRGIYICEVIHDYQTIKEYVFLHIISQDFSLVVPAGPVHTDLGSDIILPAHLSLETNAVSMDIRWFKGTELIYQYMNGQEITNSDYKNRVSLSIQELERGNLALTLRNIKRSDSGDYTCKIFHDRCQKTGVIHLQVKELQKRKHTRKCKHLPDELTLIQTDESPSQKTQHHGGMYAEKSELLGPTTKRRRRNSMDKDRLLMSDDSTLEKPEMEKREPRGIVERESGHQNTRRTREGSTATVQELSSPDTSSQVLQRLRTSESITSGRKVCVVVEPIMQTQREIQQTIVKRNIRCRYSPVIQSQVRVRKRSSQSLKAGNRILICQKRPEDRTQRSLESTGEKMPPNRRIYHCSNTLQ